MKIVLPRNVKGYTFDRLLSGVDLNDFDVERLLPAFFYLIVTRGRQRATAPNDPTQLHLYIDALAQHPAMIGFNTPEGNRVLDRWVRASLVKMSGIGRAKKGEQIDFLYPLSLLTYKSGLSGRATQLRGVHSFLYRAFVDLITSQRSDQAPAATATLDAMFSHSFGPGVVVGPGPKFEGRYDGAAHVDVQSLLCMYYLDGFQAPQARPKEPDLDFDPALPLIADGLERDLILYVWAYKDSLPPLALTKGFMALINFELFCYTLKLMYATNALLAEDSLPAAMTLSDSASEPSFYVDFTKERGGLSDEVATGCVDRDIEELRNFFGSVIRIKTLDRLVRFIPALSKNLGSLDTPEYVLQLSRLAGEPDVQAGARSELQTIRNESERSGDQAEIDAFFDMVISQADGDAVGALSTVLTMAQQKKAVENYVRWFYSVGGLRKPFGLLAGNIKGRRNWRYAMSDDLLMTLTQLALIEDPTGELRPTIRPRMRLTEFLAFLEKRFGVMVERVPAFSDGLAARAAAKDNLEAFKGRLRQMGFYEALSDDFNAQYLRLPSGLEVAS